MKPPFSEKSTMTSLFSIGKGESTVAPRPVDVEAYWFSPAYVIPKVHPCKSIEEVTVFAETCAVTCAPGLMLGEPFVRQQWHQFLASKRRHLALHSRLVAGTASEADTAEFKQLYGQESEPSAGSGPIKKRQGRSQRSGTLQGTVGGGAKPPQREPSKPPSAQVEAQSLTPRILRVLDDNSAHSLVSLVLAIHCSPPSQQRSDSSRSRSSTLHRLKQAQGPVDPALVKKVLDKLTRSGRVEKLRETSDGILAHTGTFSHPATLDLPSCLWCELLGVQVVATVVI